MKNTCLFLSSALLAIATGCDHADRGHASHTHGANCSHSHAKSEENAPLASPIAHHSPLIANLAHAKSECTHDRHTQAQAPKSVSVTKAAQGVMGLATIRAEKRRIASTRTLPGRWELSPDARQTVATPVGGRLDILVKPLAYVKKGDALLTVSSPDLVARAREIATLEKRLSVYRTLGTSNAELENTLTVKRAERAALLAGADENDGVVTVHSPCDALVETLEAENGTWLDTGSAILRLVNPRTLRFKATVPAADAQNLADGMSAKVGANEGSIRLGIGDGTGLIPVYVVFTNSVAELAGSRADAVCATDATENPHLAVPSESIVTIALQPTVFVQDEHDETRFLAIPVTPLMSGGGWTAVDGLPAGNAYVVREGAYELKLALQSGEAKPSGHFHADGVFHEGEH